MMASYTYSIFDSTGSGVWPDHDRIVVEAASITTVLANALRRARSTGETCGEYVDGDTLHVTVWDADGVIVAKGHVELHIEAVEEPTKDDVRSWESVASFVTEFPDGDDVGYADVAVEIGEAGGRWFLRTTDDAGGSDECDDTSYSSEAAATEAAEEYAEKHDEGDGQTAEECAEGGV